MSLKDDPHIKSLNFEEYKKFTEERLEVLAKCVYSLSKMTETCLESVLNDEDPFKRLVSFRGDLRKIEDCLYTRFLGD